MAERSSGSKGWGSGVRGVLLAAVVVLASPLETAATGELPFEVTEERERCENFDPLRRPFFGDTHIHTAYSFDAGGQDTRNTPRDAYAFSKGAEVGLQPYTADGKPTRTAQLRRPLDFAMVSDHSEALGEVRICRDEANPEYDSDFCFFFRNFGPVAFNALAVRTIVGKDRWKYCGEDDALCLKTAEVVWGDIQAAAEEAYDRTPACTFTSFIGYEYTASGGGGANLHRNVLFRNDKVPAYPTSWVETPSARDLWTTLQQTCIEGNPGCDVLTIPHNSNLGGPTGLMFQSAGVRDVADADMPVDAEEARLRQRWEPLIEIMQHKGDSECLLGGDTTDEACGFEKLPYNSFAGVGRFRALNLDADLEPTRKGMVREALKKGIRLEDEIGVNPLKYGIIASTDSHLGTPGLTAEDDSKGHGGAGMRGSGAGLPDDLEFNPGGLAVIWAEENSRDSIFAAMQRREAYGTSGTRPTVRFFGGYDYADDLCEDPAFVEKGYAGGVPMGGDLAGTADGGAPKLAVWALQDTGTEDAPGTPLQRIQIVKGWVEDGKVHEKVFDVAGGPNDASVDLATCERKGAGERQLCSVWTDPEFEADERSFYYARVLENPTCRWSQQLCVEAGIDCADPASVPAGYAGCCAPEHVRTIQERAWTSPIWYAPTTAD